MKTTLASALSFLVFLAAVPADDRPGAQLPPSEKSIKRAKELRAGVAGFQLSLNYFGPQDKPFYKLTLSVRAVEQLAIDPFHPMVEIDEAQAEKIIKALLADGFLDRAQDDRVQDITLRAPKGPTYVMTVRADTPEFGLVQFHEDLGWNLEMLERLDSLKSVLGQKPQAGLDSLLGRLAGQRQEWNKAQD
jgi:hypothetical protein